MENFYASCAILRHWSASPCRLIPYRVPWGRFESVYVSCLENLGRFIWRLPNRDRPRRIDCEKAPTGPVSRFRKVKEIAGQIGYARRNVSQMARIQKTRNSIVNTFCCTKCVPKIIQICTYFFLHLREQLIFRLGYYN